MRSSTWRALGNTYVVVEPGDRPLDAARAARARGRAATASSRSSGPRREPWRSRSGTLTAPAPSSRGTATRIAAAWLAAQSESARGRGRGRRSRRAHAHPRDRRARAGSRRRRGRSAWIRSTALSFVPVSVGNPHAVVLGDPDTITRVGPLLETHERFPNRTNVQVARVDRPGEVTARVWERGVGETPSSGTSAVAVAAATHDARRRRRALPGRRSPRASRERPGDALRHRRARLVSHACASSTSRPSGSRRYADRPHG